MKKVKKTFSQSLNREQAPTRVPDEILAPATKQQEQREKALNLILSLRQTWDKSLGLFVTEIESTQKWLASLTEKGVLTAQEATKFLRTAQDSAKQNRQWLHKNIDERLHSLLAPRKLRLLEERADALQKRIMELENQKKL